MAKKKVLLMGKSGSGKTSMRSFIFANYMARDTMRLSPTLDVEHHHVRFLGNLVRHFSFLSTHLHHPPTHPPTIPTSFLQVLNLWDCGGQDAFYESYFDSQRDLIFRSVEVLIYVFDVESADTEKDISHFMGVLEVRVDYEMLSASSIPPTHLPTHLHTHRQAIDQYSPDAKLFVLIHKMDLVPENEREAVFLDRQKVILGQATSRFNFSVTFFKTSIWDETLYKAWSSIVYQLIPNVKSLESQLQSLCEICGADEVRLVFLCFRCIVVDETRNRLTRFHPPTHPPTSDGPVRKGHLPGHLPRHPHRPRGRAPLREDLQHHQAVQTQVGFDIERGGEICGD